MQVIYSLAIVVQVLAAIGVIVLVLLQHGKGADMGAAFGSGSSGSLFGATGSANFLSRLTAVLATVFFVCTLLLAFAATSRPSGSGSVMDNLGAPGTQVPAAPARSGPADVPAAPGAAPATPASGIPK